MLSSIRKQSVRLVGLRPAFVRLNQIRTFQERRAGPPPLPKEDQEEFERLQKLASSQEAIDSYNAQFESDHTMESVKSPILKNDIGGFSPEFMKTIPEFEGEKNPKTGEIVDQSRIH